jgi:hypothetical protein
MMKEKIRGLFERLGRALSEGDLPAATGCWELPALVLSEDDAIAVVEPGAIEQAFLQAVELYRSLGIASTRPEIRRIDLLSDRLASVDVHWPSFDVSGAEAMIEQSHYIVHLAQDDAPRIRVAAILSK